jgi:uncharacterized protein (TIGR02421 family)
MWVSYKEKIKNVSDRIVDAQKPIRVLDSVKWDPKIEEAFFASKGRSLPKVNAEYYQKTSLGFDPKQKDAELAAISSDIKKDFGATDHLGVLLLETVNQYRELIVMLEARGTKKFYESSRKLYGSPKDRLFGDDVTIMDQSRLIYQLLSSLEGKTFGQDYPKNLTSDAVVTELKKRFGSGFLKDRIDVRISDGIVADAAAGADVIKIKADMLFSKKDIDVFEVHEGWVHVATTLNGKAQKVATFLSKGPPRVAATQEGLAMLMEIITFSTYPLRARTINDRILGVDKAEDGASFIDVYEFYLTEGYSETEAFRNSMRVFRGACLEGGAPFTKDISYCRGFIENYNFIRTAIKRGLPEIVPFIFSGKVHVDDVPLLYQLSVDGVIDTPALLPPPFEDLNGLAVWMAFSNFMNTVDMKKVTEYYDALFKKHL